MCLMRRLHLAASCASSPHNSLSDKSFLMLSNHLLSSPSIPRHLHHHHSLAYIFFFSSQYMPTPLQSTFLHFLGYFSHLRCPSNSLIPNSVRHIQVLLLCLLHCPCLSTVHHCWSYNRLVYFPLTLKLILRSHRIPDTLFQFIHPDCILCVISASNLHFLPMSLVDI